MLYLVVHLALCPMPNVQASDGDCTGETGGIWHAGVVLYFEVHLALPCMCLVIHHSWIIFNWSLLLYMVAVAGAGCF